MSGNLSKTEAWMLAPFTGGTSLLFVGDKKKHSSAAAPSGADATASTDFGGVEASKAEERKRLMAQKAQILSGGTGTTNTINTGAV